ncbi:MAG TPA: hypothetical protein VMG12_20815 [Polyangiaceae bacterium]|nr:hypothetical protein [Polyangiaceae bacterium]
MMKHTTAHRAAQNPRTPWFVALLAPAIVALIAACQGAPEPEPAAPADDALGSGAQSLSAADCRADLSTCLSAGGGGVSDFGHCTLDFESCFTDAALDRIGQGQLLAQCRSRADDCLDAAVSATDIGACGDVLVECADDVRDDTRGLFPFVRPLVSRVFGTSVRAVRGVFDVVDALPAVALSGVRTCRDEVITCLDAAVTDLDVGICADSLDTCVDGVVDIIDPVLDPLPGPNGSGIVAATGVCRADARDCLAGAVSLNDISACSDVLGDCVDGVEDILNETVDDVNDIIDPLAVPKPENVIDCTLGLAQCLADLENPFDCAEQARICASQ